MELFYRGIALAATKGLQDAVSDLINLSNQLQSPGVGPGEKAKIWGNFEDTQKTFAQIITATNLNGVKLFAYDEGQAASPASGLNSSLSARGTVAGNGNTVLNDGGIGAKATTNSFSVTNADFTAGTALNHFKGPGGIDVNGTGGSLADLMAAAKVAVDNTNQYIMTYTPNGLNFDVTITTVHASGSTDTFGLATGAGDPSAGTSAAALAGGTTAAAIDFSNANNSAAVGNMPKITGEFVNGQARLSVKLGDIEYSGIAAHMGRIASHLLQAVVVVLPSAQKLEQQTLIVSRQCLRLWVL